MKADIQTHFSKRAKSRQERTARLRTVFGAFSLGLLFVVGGCTSGLANTGHPPLGINQQNTSAGFSALDLAPAKSDPEAMRIASVLAKDIISEAKKFQNLHFDVSARFIPTSILPKDSLIIVYIDSDASCGAATGCTAYIFEKVDSKKNVWKQVFYNMGDEFSFSTDAKENLLFMNMLRGDHTSHWVMPSNGGSFELIKQTGAIRP
ncbi:MAG: hypothetical protein KDJ49_09135 [Alphaproteobacteria bacterium]|nr:hypothetical protein [Alphaproteobacteria bacterium]USO07421.1 MAG: hypothetical protein H6866_08385 [Rhodospirillales bacterium]